MKLVRSKEARHLTHIQFAFTGETEGVPDFDAKPGETAVRYETGRTVIHCGLGDKADMAPHKIRTAAANGVRAVRKLERMGVSVLLPSGLEGKVEVDLACVEGLILGAYDYSEYKSKKPKALRTCQLVGMEAPPKKLKNAVAACEAACYARDLVNENADSVHPERLAAEARSLCTGEGFSVSILTEKNLEKQGLGLLHAVGRGSSQPPRLILMHYNGAPEKAEKTAILGKGITFDSGGQNLKPTGAIEDMRSDMAGAAAVLGVMKALGEIRPRINVTGVVAAAHNAIGKHAYFPGDVYTSYLGKTVEITNTDAEGRLVLADAAAYCEKNVRPTRMVDLATLTGAILIALGPSIAGLFTQDDGLADKLFQSGERTRERLWRLPLYEEFFEAMKSDRADLRNTAKLKKGYAGSITGAAFIGEFVENTPWAHLDIAGAAFNEGSPSGETPQHGTGFGVRLLLDFLDAV